MEASVDIIAAVEVESLHHFFHHVGRLQLVDLIIDVGVSLKEAHVGKGIDFRRHGSSLRFIFDHDRSGAGVDWGRAQQIKYRRSKTHGQ